MKVKIKMIRWRADVRERGGGGGFETYLFVVAEFFGFYLFPGMFLVWALI